MPLDFSLELTRLVAFASDVVEAIDCNSRGHRGYYDSRDPRDAPVDVNRLVWLLRRFNVLAYAIRLGDAKEIVDECDFLLHEFTTLTDSAPKTFERWSEFAKPQAGGHDNSQGHSPQS